MICGGKMNNCNAAYKAYLIMRHKKNRDKICILYECSCECDQKHFHHPNYKQPLLVVKLCPTCHYKEHSRTGERRILCEGCGRAYRSENEKICYLCEYYLSKGFQPQYPKRDFRGRPLKANWHG